MATIDAVTVRTDLGSEWTVADLAERFGSLRASRIRTDVPPGTAHEEDVERTGLRCELIDGVLVERAVSDYSSVIGLVLARLLGNFVAERRLGWVHGEQGFFRLAENLRASDVAFTPKERRPGGLLRRGWSDVAPSLVAEVLSPGNTADEMARKRKEFFARGTELFWIVDPLARTIEIYTGPETPDATLRDGDALTGGSVLPGFTLAVRDLFDAADLSDDAPS